VARSGPSCSLDAAIGIGGGLDMRWNYLNRRSLWLWQPFLSRTLLDTLIHRFVPNYLKDAVGRGDVTQEQVDATLAAGDVTAIDVHMIAPYNGFGACGGASAKRGPGSRARASGSSAKRGSGVFVQVSRNARSRNPPAHYPCNALSQTN
jgi:hypothetical protein